MEVTGTATMTPRDFEALRTMIIDRKHKLPRRLAQVAAYALDNPDDIAFGTAASIAASADVQPSTLVRFAQHFGFDGFSDLQRVFRERLIARTSSYEERLAAIAAGTAMRSLEDNILEGFLTAATQSIEAISHSLNRELLPRVAERLARAETIYLIAQRRSFPISSYMAYAFGKLKIRSLLVGSPAGIDPELLAMAGPKDAAVAVSFSPYAPATSEFARQLDEQGVPVVAITDSAFSPLAEIATEWFEVSENDFSGFRSLSATMALAMAITVSVAERRRMGRSHQKQVE